MPENCFSDLTGFGVYFGLFFFFSPWSFCFCTASFRLLVVPSALLHRVLASDSGSSVWASYVKGGAVRSRLETWARDACGWARGGGLVACRLHLGWLPACFFGEALMSVSLVFPNEQARFPREVFSSLSADRLLEPSYEDSWKSRSSSCRCLLDIAPVFVMVLLLPLCLVPLVQLPGLSPSAVSSPTP